MGFDPSSLTVHFNKISGENNRCSLRFSLIRALRAFGHVAFPCIIIFSQKSNWSKGVVKRGKKTNTCFLFFGANAWPAWPSTFIFLIEYVFSTDIFSAFFFRRLTYTPVPNFLLTARFAELALKIRASHWFSTTILCFGLGVPLLRPFRDPLFWGLILIMTIEDL